MQVLDPEQLELSGTAVVEASAGTGKTYTITSLYLRLLLERGLGVEQILVLTYTRAATAELRDRIRKRIAHALAVAKGESSSDAFVTGLCARIASELGAPTLVEKLERALAGVDEAPVLTIHGFCQRVLREHAFESGSAFDARLTAHAGPLLDEIASDYFMRELYEATPERAARLLDEPKELRELALRVSGRELSLLPDLREERDFDHVGFRALLLKARELWNAEREPIVERVRRLKGVGSRALGYADTVHNLLHGGEHADFIKLASFTNNFTLSALQKRSKPEDQRAHEHPFFELADRLLEGARAALAHHDSISTLFRRRFVAYLESELVRRTRKERVRTFDALLGDLDQALASPRGPALAARLRDKYKAALVDEFQDTDPLQYRIFRRIFADGSAPLLLIGDPKQAIYGFRGADVAAYLGARDDAGERVYTLGVNHRSDATLIDALNALYASVDSPFALDEISYQPVLAAQRGSRLAGGEARAPLDLALLVHGKLSADQQKREIARQVASDIAALLASAPERHDGTRTRALAAADIAVLCRTNREAAIVQEELSERGIPSVLSGDASVFDSEDVPQLERALNALAHPGDTRALRSFLASIYGGEDAAAILALEADDGAWEKHRETFQRLHETWLAHGFIQALRGLTAHYQVEERLLARPDGMRRVTNLWHLAELLAEAAASERLGPLGLLRWFALVRRDAALRSELVGDAHELRLESSEDAVSLTTVHKSKGLEFPVVYCPYLWDNAVRKSEKYIRFHDPARDDALSLYLSKEKPEEHEQIFQREQLQEALRLLYVALTRAKHRVTVVLPHVDSLAASALGYALFRGGDAKQLELNVKAMIKAGALEQELGKLGFAPRLLSLRKSPRYVSRLARKPDSGARPVKRKLDRAFRVASFSALVAKERTSFGEAGIDRDAVASEAVQRAHELEDEPPSLLALGEFPRGALAGQLVHEVLEYAEFDGPRVELQALAERLVRARGYPSELTPGLTLGLWQALHAPLDEAGFTLAQLDRGARVDEMEFVFPVDSTLTVRTLDRVFRAHHAPAAWPKYADDLRELGFDALHGFLRGFIDLVYRHDGRFYVVDYKSNWLGPRAEHYTADALARSMAEHHYYLQYHLYVLALHRHLSARLPGYDYDTHLGGVYYLFLRGMAAEHPLGTGVFHDRPSRALIDALDDMLRTQSGEARND